MAGVAVRMFSCARAILSTRSDVAWQRAIQLRYWRTFDGGDLYRSQAEWDELLLGWRVLAHRRLGVLFRNVCLYRLAV